MKLQVGVKALLKNSKGLYLLIQRSKSFSDGTKWDIPGGRIEATERLEEALAREIQEEIGATLTDTPRLVKAQDILVPDADLHVVRLTYTADFDGNVALSDEHQAFQWVTREDALAIELDPYVREVLESL